MSWCFSEVDPPFIVWLDDFQWWAPPKYLLRVDDFQRWAPCYGMTWWFSEVGSGHPLSIYYDDFQRWAPLLWYGLMIFRGGQWAPPIYLLWFPEVDPPVMVWLELWWKIYLFDAHKHSISKVYTVLTIYNFACEPDCSKVSPSPYTAINEVILTFVLTCS